MSAEKLLLTVAEAAGRLGLSLTVTKAKIKSGELRSVLVGRSRRVPGYALEEFVHRLDVEQNGQGRTPSIPVAR